jgi:hypothetical protein
MTSEAPEKLILTLTQLFYLFLQFYYWAMSVERGTVIITLIHIYEHVTYTTVNFEYRKSDPSVAYPHEIAMRCDDVLSSPRDEAVVL